MVSRNTILFPFQVVFRAVSPHGHVYWEIDPRANAVSLSDNEENKIRADKRDQYLASNSHR